MLPNPQELGCRPDAGTSPTGAVEAAKVGKSTLWHAERYIAVCQRSLVSSAGRAKGSLQTVASDADDGYTRPQAVQGLN